MADRIKAVAQSEISRIASLTFQALKSGAYLFPFHVYNSPTHLTRNNQLLYLDTYVNKQGVIYLLTHPTLRQPLQARLLPTLTLGIGVTGAMFFLTYVPQMALLALTSGPLVAPISAALLVIRESSAITGFLASTSSSPSSSSLDVDAFDAALILKGHEGLVSNKRELKGSARNRSPNVLSRLGRFVGMSGDGSSSSKGTSSSALNRLIRSLLYLPLNFIPVVGTLLFLALSGRRGGRNALDRYFELKGFTAREKEEWLEGHEGDYIRYVHTHFTLLTHTFFLDEKERLIGGQFWCCGFCAGDGALCFVCVCVHEYCWGGVVGC
jgi:hypothetical protein